MIAYVTNKKVCRSNYLLAYFGETVKEPCGICDICTVNDVTGISVQEVKDKIINLLVTEACSSRILIEKLQLKDTIILSAIRELLEDELISLNPKNQYERKK